MTPRLSVWPALLVGCLPLAEHVEDAAPAEEPEPVSVTRWTDSTELFMEYPALEPGGTARFAIHLTDLQTFQALEQGRVEVVLDHGGGHTEAFAVDGPSVPGIFGVDVEPRRGGTPSLQVRLQAGPLVDQHDLGPVAIGPAARAAEPGDSSHEHTDPGAITFTKEQQWVLEFATHVTQEKSMRRALRAPAVVEPRSGGRLMVVAPVTGRLLPTTPVPGLGKTVQLGDVVAAIVPLPDHARDRLSLELAIEEGALSLDQAVVDRERTQRLHEAGAISRRRLEEAQTRESLARARLQASRKRLEHHQAARKDVPHDRSEYSYTVRTHLGGVVTSVGVTAGAHVEEGDLLVEVTAMDPVHVTAAVPESSAEVLPQLHGAELEVPPDGRTVRIGSPAIRTAVVDAATRTLRATFLVPNPNGTLAIGQSTFLRLYTSSVQEAPTIPRSAVVDVSGQPTVYVQIGGESFLERTVRLGSREGEDVQVLEGLRAEERVVSRGAYLLWLASQSEEVPAHGHAH